MTVHRFSVHVVILILALAVCLSACAGKSASSKFYVLSSLPQSALRESLRLGRALLTYPAAPTLADGLSGGIGQIVFDQRHLVDEVVTVSEEEIEDAIVALVAHDQVVAEASGAVGVAALRAGKVARAGRGPVVAVVTGGNLDTPVLARLLAGRLAGGGEGR